MNNEPKQRRRIYEQLATTTQALDSTSDAIIIADDEGVVVYVNPAFVQSFGYNANALNTGGVPNVLFHKSVVGEQAFRIVRQDGWWKGEVELETQSGDIVPFLLSIDSITDDQECRIGFITICTDITSHKRLSAIEEEQELLALAQLNVAKALTSTLDLSEVFTRILENIDYVVPKDAANIILIDDGLVQLIDRNDYADVEQIEWLRSGNVPLDAYADLKTIVQTGAPLMISNTQQYLEQQHEIQRHTPWLNSHIGIPIRLQDKIIGFLNVDSSQPGLFNQEHAARLQLFAEQAAIAIHNARLYESAQKLAMLEERRRLARHLHDSVTQTLFSATLIADVLPRLWQSQPDDVLPRLEQIGKLNRGALAEMRTLLLELFPERLMEASIDELLHQFTEGVLGKAELDVTLKIEEGLILSPDLQEAVYYITQEALNNVVKHAEASRIWIRLFTQQGNLMLEIGDDGRGFDPHQIPAKSLGLNIMHERAQATGAKLEVLSQIGKGTKILVSWPI